jgi:hypothetical protein
MVNFKSRKQKSSHSGRAKLGYAMINPLIFFLFAGIGLLLAYTLGKYKFSDRAAIVIALIYCGTPWLIGQKNL